MLPLAVLAVPARAGARAGLRGRAGEPRRHRALRLVLPLQLGVPLVKVSDKLLIVLVCAASSDNSVPISEVYRSRS